MSKPPEYRVIRRYYLGRSYLTISSVSDGHAMDIGPPIAYEAGGDAVAELRAEIMGELAALDKPILDESEVFTSLRIEPGQPDSGKEQP